MSQAVTKRTPDQLAEAVIPLMREYTVKLNKLSRQARSLHDLAYKEPNKEPARRDLLPFEHRLLAQAFQKLAPTAKNLARNVSQQVEFAAVDAVLQIELKLRLAEFEQAIAACEQTLQRYKVP